MESTSLRLRGDLIISEQNRPEGTMFVIKDPAVDRFFRFKEIEHFIAKQFDGATTLETTQQRVEERFGVTLTTENLEQFTNRLQRIGLLTNGDGGISVTRLPWYRRVKGDIFYMRFKLFDPDRLFDRMLPRIRFLFTPFFVALSAALVVWAVGATIVHWNEITAQFYMLFRIESLLLAWFIMLGVVTLHEFAHGLTCKYFGGQVREIGFMLIYFQPAFYCNVSDAWLFPDKSHRMWVTFAGGYFEIFLWALATFIWRITDPGTSLNHFALVVTVTSAFKMFFNMNPLIKLDGYYLLSDWLDIPNLRQKASGYLGNQIRKLRGAARVAQSETTPRERWIYVTYALLSSVYIYWLLSNIALWFGGFMVETYQAWGFILFTATLGIFFRNPIKKMISNTTTTSDTAKTTKEQKRRRWPKYLKMTLFLALLVTALLYFHMELRVAGSFIVMPKHNADVRAEVEGIIEKIQVGEGDHVEKGAILAQLTNQDYNAELNKMVAEIEAKKARLKLLMSGTRPEEIQLARVQLSKAEELLVFADSHAQRDKYQMEKNLISLDEFEKSQELAVMRKRELHEAHERLNILLAGSRPEEIEAIKADIRSLEARERHLQKQLQSLVIVSPISGVVTTHKLKEKVGENLKKGDLFAEVYELKTVMVEIAVPEKEMGDVKVGQKVVLKARAYPGETFEGKVKTIAPVVTKPNEWQLQRTVIVTTELDNSQGLLKPEMTGNARIYCGQQRLLDLVTRRLVRYLRVEFWSWW